MAIQGRVNARVSKKALQFLSLLPAKYVTVLSGRTETPEMSCDLDRPTHTQPLIKMSLMGEWISNITSGR